LVSSANFKTELSNVDSKSLMNIRNKTGPRTEPRGTPLVTSLLSDLQRFMHTFASSHLT